MKPKCTCLYLYADGHAVACYEKRDPDAGNVEYVEIHERLVADKAFLGFKGRIVFHDGDAFLPLLKGARHVTATIPAVDQGSENTKRLGLAVGSLAILPAKGGELRWNLLPGLISSGFTYDDAQAGYGETFNPDSLPSTWGSRNVARVYPAPNRGSTS